MNSPGTSVLLSRLLSESPLLLVAVIGIILAAVILRRAALFCSLFGCILLLVGTLVGALIQSSLVESQTDRRTPREDLAAYYNILGIGTGLVRAVSFGLILTAALLGRSPSARRD